MNRFFHNVSLIIINFFLFNLYAFSNEEIIKTETVINDIIIFNNGASVNRTGNVILSNGSNNILISNLSSKLLNESIQFTIKSKNVIINSVNKQLNYFSSENNIQVIKLDDSIQKINEKIRLRTVDLEVLREEKDLMDQNKSVLKTSREFIIDDLMELAEYFKKKINEIQTNISLIQKEISFLNQTKKKLQNKIGSIKKTIKNKSCDIIIQTTCLKPGDFDFTLSYNTMNAGWTPFYDVRSESINSPVNLTYKAKVFQNTNEEWSNIKLSLSTGKLNVSNKAPDFNTQYIRSNNSLGYNKRIASTQFKNNSFQDEEDLPSSADFTNVDYSGTQIQYDILIPYSIPSQKTPIFIEIQKLTVPAKYDYFCYPKVDKDVFLMCHLDQINNKNLLPGQAQIYFEGKSVGTSYLDPHITQSKIDLSLSRDIGIISERILETKLSSETKVGDNLKIQKAFKISVKNNKSQSVNLVLIDQLPVSNKKNIHVQLLESSDATFTKADGKLVWKIQLAEGEQVDKVWNYFVKYPEKENLIGL